MIKKEKQDKQDVLPESTSTMHFISYIQIYADKSSLTCDTNVLSNFRGILLKFRLYFSKIALKREVLERER